MVSHATGTPNFVGTERQTNWYRNSKKWGI